MRIARIVQGKGLAAMATGFDKAIEASRIAGTRELTGRLIDERRVSRALVKSIVGAGHFVRVFDGEEYVSFDVPATLQGVVRAETFSNNVSAIMMALFSTDEDVLHVYSAAGQRLGWFHLVYGNSGEELIANYSMTETCEAVYGSELVKRALTPSA